MLTKLHAECDLTFKLHEWRFTKINIHSVVATGSEGYFLLVACGKATRTQRADHLMIIVKLCHLANDGIMRKEKRAKIRDYQSNCYTLETGYKNNPSIRRFFPRTKSCNLSTVRIAYKNKPDIRPFSSGIKGILIFGFQCFSCLDSRALCSLGSLTVRRSIDSTMIWWYSQYRLQCHRI